MEQPPRNTRNRLLFLGTALLVALLLAGALVSWKWKAWIADFGAPTYQTPALSADYLPSDTGAVLFINQRETFDSKLVKKEFGPVLEKYRDELVTRDMQNALGVDAKQDVDWIQLTLTAGDLERPLVLLSGKIDPAKFKPVPNGLRQVNKPGDRYRLYELPDPRLGRTFTLTPGDNLLLLCEKQSRVTDALADAETGRKPVLEDAALAEILKKVNRKQSIWGAASLKKLGTLSALKGEAELFLRPILDNTQAVYGGFTCGDEVEGTVYFVTSSEEQAEIVKEKLRDACKTFRGDTLLSLAALRLVPEALRPFARLLGTGDMSRDDKTVVLHCRLPKK